MLAEESKSKHRGAFIGGLIATLVLVGVFPGRVESEPTPTPRVEPTAAVSPAPSPSPDGQSIGTADGPASEKPGRTPRVESTVRPVELPPLVIEKNPVASPTPTPRQSERPAPPARVPQVTTRPFSHEPKHNPGYTRADDELNSLFKRVTARLDETERWNFTMEQRSWLNARTDLWNRGGDRAVTEFTEQRNRELRQRFGR